MKDSYQAEFAILGTLLANNDAIESVVRLKTSHFANGINRTVFSAIYSLITTNQPADVVTVSDFLEKKELLEGVGGVKAIHDLTNFASSVKNLSRYVDLVLDKANKRELIEACREAIEDSAGSTYATQLIDRTMSRLDGIRAIQTIGEPEEIASSLAKHMDLVEKRSENKERFTSTGLADVDIKLGGGLSDGDLMIVAARPSMGKTSFVLGAAMHTAQTLPVLFFSLEMTKAQLNDRALSGLGSIPIGWLRKPGPDDNDLWARLGMACEKARDLRLFIDDTPSATLIDIQSKSRRLKRKYGLGLIVVDYIGLMVGSGKTDNRTQEVGEFSRGLKSLAKELNCPVIALSQLNRGVESRTNKRPMMSDLRDSGEIEQDADVIVFIYRDEVYNPDTMDKGIAEIIVSKQRQGETGVVGCAFEGQYTRFSDLTHPWQRKTEQPKKLRFDV